MKNAMIATYVTRQGARHARRDKPNEDSVNFEMLPNNRGIIAAVSDGAGSAPRAKEGSKLAAKHAVSQTLEAILSDEEMDLSLAVAQGLSAAQEAIRERADTTETEMEDYQCTLILVAWLDDQVAAIQVGDGAVIVEANGACKMLTIPQRGQYANETYFVTEPHCEQTQFANKTSGITAMALFTDGIQKNAVDFRNRRANDEFIPQAINIVRDTEKDNCTPETDTPLPEDVETESMIDEAENGVTDIPQAGASLFHWLTEQVGHTDDDMTLIIAAKIEDA